MKKSSKPTKTEVIKLFNTLKIDKALAQKLENGDILKQLHQGTADPVNEGDYRAIYVAMLNKLHKMSQGLEDKLLEAPNSRDVYALNVLYSQQREVINDLRSIQNLDEQVDKVINLVLIPTFTNIAQNLTDLTTQLKKSYREDENLDKEGTKAANEILDKLVADYAKSLQGNFNGISDKIKQMLTEPTN